MTEHKKNIEKNYIWATGRRKTAVARVRLLHVQAGQGGKIEVNKRPFEKYFSTEDCRSNVIEPLQATKTLGKYDVYVNVNGGGITGQSGAVRLGVARALKISEPTLESQLKTGGFLTRDPRMKERKKFGLHGARRGVQFSKR